MIIGIDAGNTRTGGGLTYLAEMLTASEPDRFGIERVIIWGNKAALARMPEREWLITRHQTEHDATTGAGFLWQRRRLAVEARNENCGLLFFPGSSYVGNFRPYVAVSQNMLPFSPTERNRYGFCWTWWRLQLLQRIQGRTFRRADGMIFLTQWAKLGIETFLRHQFRQTRIVPHGISERFFRPIGEQLKPKEFNQNRPFRWIYISILAPYKHQWQVARAVARLRASGYPVAIDFIGPAYKASLKKLETVLEQLDPASEFIRYIGPVEYRDLPRYYNSADGFVFATSCENLPNILIEAMASGVPIASSKLGPMPEVLGNGGLYFNPLDVDDMADVMLRVFKDESLRKRCAEIAQMRARRYSWRRCADETFAFLSETMESYATRMSLQK